MGGNQGGQPTNPTHPIEPGSQPGTEWNRDQQSQLDKREDGTNRPSSPDGSPMQDDENGEGTTTTGPGTGTGY
jgi:hypothetical protein